MKHNGGGFTFKVQKSVGTQGPTSDCRIESGRGGSIQFRGSRATTCNYRNCTNEVVGRPLVFGTVPLAPPFHPAYLGCWAAGPGYFGAILVAEATSQRSAVCDHPSGEGGNFPLPWNLLGDRVLRIFHVPYTKLCAVCTTDHTAWKQAIKAAVSTSTLASQQLLHYTSPWLQRLVSYALLGRGALWHKLRNVRLVAVHFLPGCHWDRSQTVSNILSLV